MRPQREQACPRSPEKEAEEPVLNLDSPGSLCPAPYKAKGESLEAGTKYSERCNKEPWGSSNLNKGTCVVPAYQSPKVEGQGDKWQEEFGKLQAG